MTKNEQLAKLISKYILLLCLGGSVYCGIELIYRGYTHWTMFFLGGLCFIGCGLVNQVISWSTPLIVQMLICAIMVTVLEFLTGCIVNLWFHLGVWDYSNLKWNILGQVSLPFTIIWYFLSLVGIVVDDYIRYWAFDEEKPRYKLF